MRINANNAQTEQIKSIKLNNEALLDNLTKGRSQYNITDNSNQKYAAVMKISQEGTNKQQGMNLEKDNEGDSNFRNKRQSEAGTVRARCQSCGYEDHSGVPDRTHMQVGSGGIPRYQERISIGQSPRLVCSNRW